MSFHLLYLNKTFCKFSSHLSFSVIYIKNTTDMIRSLSWLEIHLENWWRLVGFKLSDKESDTMYYWCHVVKFQFSFKKNSYCILKWKFRSFSWYNCKGSMFFVVSTYSDIIKPRIHGTFDVFFSSTILRTPSCHLPP